MDIIYFELNNWFIGRDYPNEEPFLTWMSENKFSDDKWCKENKLVVVKSYVDMSLNFCIAATMKWVEGNCPKLLSSDFCVYKVIKYSKNENITEIHTKPYFEFLRPYGENPNFGYFMEYKEENFGLHIDYGEDYDLWNHEEEDNE